MTNCNKSINVYLPVTRDDLKSVIARGLPVIPLKNKKIFVINKKDNKLYVNTRMALIDQINRKCWLFYL